MAPYCSKPIVPKMLPKNHVAIINGQNKRILDTLSPLLKDDAPAMNYLQRECANIMT